MLQINLKQLNYVCFLEFFDFQSIYRVDNRSTTPQASLIPLIIISIILRLSDQYNIFKTRIP